MPVIVISIAIISSYMIGAKAIDHGGLFGTAVATMGMLGTAAYILAMDTFGPITDNAGGIVEMSQQPEEIRKKTDRLDSVGNTTKALTKGYAIGSAALAAFLLFSAYMDEVGLYRGTPFHTVDISRSRPSSSAACSARCSCSSSRRSRSRRSAGRRSDVIEDVRAQFKEKPGIMAGTEKPDYARSVDLVTRGALKQMILPGVIAVGMPIAVGLVFKMFITPEDPTIAAEAVASLLMVGTIAGILMALFLNNAGGAWDNAKKYIESGEFKVDGKVVGKKSDPHKAAVVGDTVGDPFKDTAGPSLHVLDQAARDDHAGAGAAVYLRGSGVARAGPAAHAPPAKAPGSTRPSRYWRNPETWCRDGPQAVGLQLASSGKAVQRWSVRLRLHTWRSRGTST